MYFALSTTLAFFSTPTNVFLGLALLGLVLVWLRRPLGRTLLFAATLVLVLAGFSPLGNMLLTPLEQRFPGFQFSSQRVDGIIVLGGSFDRIRGYLSTIILDEAANPIVVVAGLSKRYPDAKIIFTGGTAVADANVPPEAEAARQLFISFGIDPGRIVIEDKSRNTRENAWLTKDRIAPKPDQNWLLVTNAFHMPRAIGTFRRAGFNVTAFSVGWRTNGWRDFWWPAPSATENLRRVDVAVHEWLGLAVYRVLGYSNAAFPGPPESAKGW